MSRSVIIAELDSVYYSMYDKIDKISNEKTEDLWSSIRNPVNPVKTSILLDAYYRFY